MRSFDDILAIAADRKGGRDAVESRLSHPLHPDRLAAIPDDRWLSAMARCIFQAGFNWAVIDQKWPGFEAAFEGFPPGRLALWQGDDLDRLLRDEAIVRNAAKIQSVLDNAAFLADLEREHGSAARVFAYWPGSDYIGLLDLLAKNGSRLGGNTGQRFLRMMGKDSFILSDSVTARLIAEGVVAKAPSSRRDMLAVQAAFDTWCGQSGRSMTEVSQILAWSIDP